MKKYLLVLIAIMVCNLAFGQLTITPGTHWVNNGAAVIVLRDIDLVNNGTIVKGNSLVKFSGKKDNVIRGSAVSNFNELEMAKNGNASVKLLSNIDVSKRVVFTSGLLHLNKYNLTLAPVAYLFNESESSRITGLNGGEVIITVPLNAPMAINPGNLGAVITSASNLGAVTLRRGHKAQSGDGLASSIQRYFDISPANNKALAATLRYYYFDAEMNGQSENVLEMYLSTNAGTSWVHQAFSSRNTIDNFVEKTDINSFSRWALSSTGGLLSVAGLEFIGGKYVHSVATAVAGSGEKTMSLKVWPIPSQGDVNVSLMGVEKDMLQVFDMSGRLVQQSQILSKGQQKISGLKPGTYIIRLAGQNGHSQKIIIQ